jgi:hypothetical protein
MNRSNCVISNNHSMTSGLISVRAYVEGRDTRLQARCFLKKAIVRSQASLAAASW